MDPTILEAKTRHIAPKALKHEGDQTDFSKEMEMNPFAHALTMPIRQCQITKVKLPSHFLLPITASISPLEIEGDAKKPHVRLVADLDEPIASEERCKGRNYLLAQHDAMDYTTARRRWPLLITERMRHWLASRIGTQAHAIDPKKAITWDANVPETVLTQLREGVLHQLRAAIRHNLVVVIRDYVELAEFQEYSLASLLVLEPDDDEEATDYLYEVEALSAPGAEVRVHSLAWLLGDMDVLERLSTSQGVKEKVGGVLWFGVLKTHRSVKLRLAVERLESFLRTKSTA